MSVNIRGNQGQEGQYPTTELKTLCDIITNLVPKVDDNIPFKGKKVYYFGEITIKYVV